jgi:hypothetical protein
VTGALRSDPETALGREGDHRDHVLDGLGQSYGSGLLINGEIPRLACVFPARVFGENELVCEARLGLVELR